MTNVPQFLTAAELAQQYGISRAHVYNLMARGLPSVKLGRSRRFRLAECDQWLDAQQAPTDSDAA